MDAAALVAALPGAAWIFDLETKRLLAVSDATVERYGWSRDELLTMTVLDLCPPEPAVDGSCVHVTKDDRRLDVDVVGSDIEWQDRPARMEVVYDLSGLRRLEERLRQSQKMEALGKIAGGIAHDFTNLLAVITMWCDLLGRDPDLSEVQRKGVEGMAKAAGEGAALTRQLMTFSRPRDLAPEIVVLGDVLLGMQAMLEGMVGGSIRLRLDLEPRLRPVRVDTGQVERVVLNLVLNAKDAMPDGGVLTAETAAAEVDAEAALDLAPLSPGPHVMLRVSDTGTGMDGATLARMFEPFFTTKPTGQGTGLGLATVYGIVERSGGAIAVTSTPGRGTTFRIYFPAVDRRE